MIVQQDRKKVIANIGCWFFEGGKQKYIGLDENQIAEIQSWLPGSNLDEPWQEFNKIKDQEKQLMAEIKERKKEITKNLRLQ